MIRQLPGILCAPLILLMVDSGLSAQVTFTVSKVARPGDAAPVGQELVRASSPSLNDSGAVAFAGDSGVFFSPTIGGPILVAGYGDPAPGGGTFISAGRDPLSMNASGQVVFLAQLAPPGNDGVFLYSSSGGVISKVAANGDPAPGGGTLRNFRFPALNDGGQVAFISNFPGGRGVFLSTSGTITRLVRNGDQAPGGGTFSAAFSSLSLNANGIVAFVATAVSGTSSQGIYLAGGGAGIQKVARAGDPAPQGGAFSSFGAPSLNAGGQLAFVGTVDTGATGLYFFSQGQITRLAAVGDPAPGGGAFTSLASPSLNAAGDVAFTGGLSLIHPSCCFETSGVFLYSGGNFSSIVLPGDSSPELSTFASGLTPSLNGSGGVAFTGRLSGSVGGIYLSSGGQIGRIAGQGDAVIRDPKFWQAFFPVINNVGQIMFGASMFPGAVGIFSDVLRDVIRAGDPLPDGGADVFVGVPPTLNDNGDAALWAQSSTATTGLFLSPAGGTLSTITSSGAPAPGGGTFTNFADAFLAMNNAGQVVADATVSPPGRSGLFRFSDSPPSAIVRLGDPAPGGGNFTEIGPGAINDNGDIAFVGFVSAPGRSGIFLWSANTLTVGAIAQDGDPAPGGGTLQFLNFQEFDYVPSINNAGQVAFGANVVNVLIPAEGVFLYSGGVLGFVARPGSTAPGGGTFFDALLPSLSGIGEVAFVGDTTLTSGVYFFSGGTTSKVAVVGDPAPGGGNFTLPGVFAIGLNNQGKVVFDGLLSTGSIGVFLATPQPGPAATTYQQRERLPSANDDGAGRTLDPGTFSNQRKRLP